MIKPYLGILPTITSSVFIEDTAVVVGDVTIDSESSVWFNSVIRGDVHYIRIGHRTNVQDLSLLHVTHNTHPLVIGDDVTIGHNVVLHGCTIGNRVLIGMGSIVMDGAIIEDDCVIGAGSLVTQGTVITSHNLALGSPAHIQRSLKKKELAWIKESANNYIWYAKQYMTE